MIPVSSPVITKRERSLSMSPATDKEEDVPAKKYRVSPTRKRKLESSMEPQNQSRRPNSRMSQKRYRSASTSGESEIEPPPRNTRI